MKVPNKITLGFLVSCLVLTVSVVLPLTVLADCGGTKTEIIKCPDGRSGASAIVELIKIGIISLSVLIGIVATGAIAYASVIYASARDSEAQVEQSKTLIRNVIIGLILYGFMVAIVNSLIPGGVIGL